MNSDSKVFEMFHNSKLKRLSCNLVHLDRQNDSNLSHLSSHLGWIDLNIMFKFFNITSIEINSMIHPNPHTIRFFNHLSVMFPNLDCCRMGAIYSTECFSGIPSVKSLELTFKEEDLSFDSCKTFHDNISFGFGDSEKEIARNFNLSALDYLQKYSKYWILAIGEPNFLVITNISTGIDGLGRKHRYCISLRDDDIFGAMECESPVFKTRKYRNIWIHSSPANLHAYRSSDDLLDYGIQFVKKIAKNSDIFRMVRNDFGK